jgi:hypothetical protein
MSIPQEQTRFTIGELDPKLYSRPDIEAFGAACKTAKNLLTLPEGGMISRPGTVYIDRLPRQLTRVLTANLTATAPNGGSTVNANDNNTATFFTTTTNIGGTNPYVVIQYDLGSIENIGFVDILNCRFTPATGGTTDTFQVQYSDDAVTWFSAAESFTISDVETSKRIRLLRPARYIRFVKLTPLAVGAFNVTLSEFNVWLEEDDISVAKRIDFIFNADQTYIVFLTDKNITIFRNDTYTASVRAVNYTEAVIPTVYSIQTADFAFLFHPDVAPSSLIRIDDTNWNLILTQFDSIPYYNYTTNTTLPIGSIVPSAVLNGITITGTGTNFTAAYLNQYIEGNGGRARVTKVVSTTEIKAVVEIPFYNTDSIATNDWELESGYELEWSNTRGWPVCGEFFQGRLLIGGSKSRPRTLYGSRVGEYLDFDIGAGRDDDAFAFDLDNDEPILSIVGNRNLQVFTTGGELASIQSRLTPTTTQNFNVISQTRNGSKSGIKPVIIDGNTLFLMRGGHSIGLYVFTEAEQAYDTTNLTFFSSHIIKDPVDIAVRRVTNSQEANYLLIVNNDGTLTFGCILGEQGVKGFTQTTTQGLFKNVAVDGNDMYCVVKRTVNGQDNLYLERFDFNIYTDSSVYIENPVTGLVLGKAHLNGETCKYTVGNNVQEDIVIPAGALFVPNYSDSIRIGLNFDVEFESLPYRNLEMLGPGIDYTYCLDHASVYGYNVSSMTINGSLVSFYSLAGVNPLDAQTPIFSGIIRVEANGVWDDEATLRITRPDPLPFGFLSITRQVSAQRKL